MFFNSKEPCNSLFHNPHPVVLAAPVEEEELVPDGRGRGRDDERGDDADAEVRKKADNELAATSI